MTDAELDKLDAALASQIGDDVSVVFNHESLFKRSREAIATLRAELDAARGRVKPLEWREVNDGNRRKGEVFGTRSPVSFAPITAHKKHDGWWLSADCKTYPTLEAAKAAAQADYTARILATLEPDPAVVRMREALELAANRLHRCSVDYDTGTHEFIETGEWAAEARAAITAWENRNG